MKIFIGGFFLVISIYLQAQKVDVITSEFIFNNAPFASCHAATIVELSNQELMVSCFGGPFESSPQTSIWLSSYQNNKWATPNEIANGIINDSTRFACWNPVLFKTKRNTLFLFYKVGVSPRDWFGMMKYSTDEGKSWSSSINLPQLFLGPIKNQPLQLNDGSLLHPSSTESKDLLHWNIHLEKSDSTAKHWQYINIDCDTFNVIQPTILQYGKDSLQLLCRSKQNYIIQSWSFNNGTTWQPLTKTNLQNPNSGIDAVTLSNKMQLLVYNPLLSGKDWMYGKNKLVVAVSNNGINWKDIYTLEDMPSGEFSYPSVIQTKDKLIHIVYTYNRKNIKHIVLKVE